MSTVLAQASGLPTLHEALSFVGLPAKSAKSALAGSTSDLIRSITTFLDGMIQEVIGSRTAQEFLSIEAKVFPDYCRVMRSVAELVSVMAPKHVLDSLVRESLCGIEADMRDEGVARFGVEVRDQAIFTAWTLRKINALITQLRAAAPLSDELKSRDIECAMNFNLNFYRTQFYLDCLAAAIRFNTPIYPDVVPELTNGLRSAVNAYGWIRQAVDLRIPQQEPLVGGCEWDEEDEDLLKEATRGLVGEPA